MRNPHQKGWHPVGEKESEPFQFTFNGFLKVAFQGSRVTSDAGLILVRELDERLGLEAIIAEHLRDSRQGLNTQFPLPDLLRQSIYSRLAGCEQRPLRDGLLSPVVLVQRSRRLLGGEVRWSLTSLQQRLVKTGERLVKHARYYWLLLAESHLTRRLFGSMLRRIWALPVPAG